MAIESIHQSFNLKLRFHCSIPLKKRSHLLLRAAVSTQTTRAVTVLYPKMGLFYTQGGTILLIYSHLPSK